MTAVEARPMAFKADEETGRVGLTSDAPKKSRQTCLLVGSAIGGIIMICTLIICVALARDGESVRRDRKDSNTTQIENLFNPALHPGSCIELAGLLDDNHQFNGLQGVCEEFNTYHGLWWVRLMSGTVHLLEELNLKPVLHQGCWVQVDGLKNRKQERFNGQQGKIQKWIRNRRCPGCWRVKLESGLSVDARPESVNSTAPPHFASALPLVTKSGEPAPATALRGKVVAFYFSAHWCPFCVKFTPKLLHFYDALKAMGDNMEIIFVSGDRSQEQFEDYYRNDMGDWLAIEYGSPEIQRLKKQYKLKSWPTFVIVDRTGAVVVPTDYAIEGVARTGSDNDIMATYAWWKQLGW